jgi:hypothetical protein
MSVSDEHQWWASHILWRVLSFIEQADLSLYLSLKNSTKKQGARLFQTKNTHIQRLVMSISDEQHISLRCVSFLWTRRFILRLVFEELKNTWTGSAISDTKKHTHQEVSDEHPWRASVMSISDEHHISCDVCVCFLWTSRFILWLVSENSKMKLRVRLFPTKHRHTPKG